MDIIDDIEILIKEKRDKAEKEGVYSVYNQMTVLLGTISELKKHKRNQPGFCRFVKCQFADRCNDGPCDWAKDVPNRRIKWTVQEDI